MNSKTRPSPKPSAAATRICLEVITGQNLMSFKNCKRAIYDEEKEQFRTLTAGKAKQRMERLEKAIEFALYSSCRTEKDETDSDYLKRLRTVLSGLCDDSLKEIPEFSFGVEYVAKGREGVRIEIEEI